MSFAIGNIRVNHGGIAHLLLSAFLFLACACSTPGPGRTTKEPPVSSPRVFRVPMAKQGIVMDGLLADAEWRSAIQVELLQHWAGAKPQNTGFVRILWDEEHIYFACEFKDDDLYADLTAHDSTTWHNDTFEVFLKPSEDSTVYYEFHVTPNNTTMDAMMPAKDARRFEYTALWESGIASAVRIAGTLNDCKDDEGWTAEVRIPWRAFADLFPRPAPGDRWRVAVCRFDYTIRGDNPIRSATALFTVLSYHRLQEYDYLEFVE